MQVASLRQWLTAAAAPTVSAGSLGRGGRSAALALLLLTPPAAAQESATVLPTVEVVAPSPAGGGIDRDKVPATVQTVSPEDIKRTGSPNLTDTLFQRIPGVSLSDPAGNSSQQQVNYRGFAASPLQGTPQGLAVYANGIRINEAFGDTVNWDLIPTNAIERTDLWSSNPVFGLNAIGGAVNIQMKNGFTFDGHEIEIQGGSYGRFNGGAEYGARFGDFAGYLAVEGVHDDGWRFKSPANIVRGYGDLGWRSGPAELHLTGLAATSSLGANAATPVQLLQLDDRAVYTTPQTTDNMVGQLGLNGRYDVTDTWSLQGNVYVRSFRQRHLDGNDGDFERCSAASSPAFRGRLCLEDDGFPRPTPVTAAFRDQFAVLDASAESIPCPPGAGNTCATTPYGTLDRTSVDSTTIGATLQATNTDKLFGHGNNFVTGASVDHGETTFKATSTLGFINPDLTVNVNPAIPGNGSVISTLGGVGFTSVGIDTRTTYYGLYAVDTFDVTDRLSATAGARLNIAEISVRDVRGTAPDLTSDETYTRLNPMVGFSYKMTDTATAFFGYSESNRAPTPLELGCSNPTRPCLLESFLVSDPPLNQVVGRTYEAGLRGAMAAEDGKLDWRVTFFRTDVTDDIVSLGSSIAGRGFFQNVPGTRRQGVEAGIQYHAGPWQPYFSYSFVDPTYQFTGDIASPNNPMSDANGNVHVTPGKQIPGIPNHQAKFGLDYAVTPEWKIGGDIVVVGSRYYIGDDANQNQKLPGYWLANLRTSYQITENVQAFALVNNLFDERYALLGAFFSPSGVTNAGLPVVLTDPRTQVLGPPLSIYGGLRFRF